MRRNAARSTAATNLAAVPARTRPGRTDLVACHALLRWLGAAFGAGGQPDRAEPLLGAAEVLRELLERPETPARLAMPGFVAPGAGRRTVGSGWPTHDKAPSVLRPRPPVRQARAETEQDGVVTTPVLPPPLLSPRERDVLALLVEGYSNAAIAEALWISQRTAETHVANILGKIGVPSRTAAIAYAVRHGLLE